MDTQLQGLIIWPDRDVLQKTMRASTWLNYKHKGTAKVLLRITPQGVISFVSESLGGCASDKYIIEHCGILKKLLPGDIVLAYRGFDIAESVGMMQAQLPIPTFTKGKQQLSALEVENTRTIANASMLDMLLDLFDKDTQFCKVHYQLTS